MAFALSGTPLPRRLRRLPTTAPAWLMNAIGGSPVASVKERETSPSGLVAELKGAEQVTFHSWRDPARRGLAHRATQLTPAGARGLVTSFASDGGRPTVSRTDYSSTRGAGVRATLQLAAQVPAAWKRIQSGVAVPPGSWIVQTSERTERGQTTTPSYRLYYWQQQGSARSRVGVQLTDPRDVSRASEVLSLHQPIAGGTL